MVNKVKLDPTAGTEFEEAPEEAFVPDTDPNPVEHEAPAVTAEEQEQIDAEAAGVNTDDTNDTKVRKREYKLLMKEVEKQGTLYGGGKTSMINLAERLVEAAMRKAISLADANKVYDTFRKAAEAKGQVEDGGVIPDAAVVENAKVESNEDSYESQLRKIKAMIVLGNTFDEEGAGAYDLMRRTRNLHLKLLEGDRETLKKGSTYTIMVGVANAHIGERAKRKISQGCMTDEELREHMYVAPAEPSTPADEWKKVLDALLSAEAAKKGGKGEGARKPITSDTLAGEQLDRAIEHLRNTLGIGAPERLKKIDDDAAEALRKIDEANEKKANAKKKAA